MKWFPFTLFALGVVSCPLVVSATSLAEQTGGKILLQVEKNGEAWYVNPENELRYYLGSPSDAFRLMTKLGVGITDANLALIPKAKQPWDGDITVMPSVRGKILLQVEQHGEAWYVNPTTGKRHYLGSPSDAFNVMKKFGVGITNSHLDQIEIAGAHDSDTIPNSYYLNVPFTSQAPTGNWSSPYNEACEETILVMLAHYKAGTSFSATQAEEEIQALVQWELATYGKHEDTSVDETANTAQVYKGLNVHTSRTVTIKRLKQLISEGKPVLVPVHGAALGNPHYSGNGTLYHMVLLIGYDQDEFITNDPGTRYGGGYRYNVNTFYNAIHDLTDPESDIAQGEKAIVILD